MMENVKKRAKALANRYKAFRKTPLGKKFFQFGSYLIQAVVIGVILYQLTDIGWNNFFSSLPTHPGFYLLFLFIYFLLPFAEIIAYKIIWNLKFIKSIPIFIKKRIFNKDVMGYSGELVLMQWAVSSKSVNGKEAFKDIRDMNIISSAASTLVALGILIIFIATGTIRVMDYLFSRSIWDYVIALFFVTLLLLTAYRFRSYLFSMPLKPAAKVFSIHFIRMLLVYCAQIFQWHLVLPDISLEVWFTFLSINIVISRIPFIPNHELVATGTNIEVAKLLQAPVAGVAGVFLVHNVLDKLLNLVFYLYFSMRSKVKPSTLAADQQEAEERLAD